MTPDEVHTVAFRMPPIGSRGYDERAVDQVLDLIEDTLRGSPRITRDELAGLDFKRASFGRRGYRAEDVDAFIDRVIAEWPD